MVRVKPVGTVPPPIVIEARRDQGDVAECRLRTPVVKGGLHAGALKDGHGTGRRQFRLIKRRRCDQPSDSVPDAGPGADAVRFGKGGAKQTVVVIRISDGDLRAGLPLGDGDLRLVFFDPLRRWPAACRGLAS